MRQVCPRKTLIAGICGSDIHRAAGPWANWCYRTTSKNSLPLVAGLCEEVHDV